MKIQEALLDKNVWTTPKLLLIFLQNTIEQNTQESDSNNAQFALSTTVTSGLEELKI